MSKENVKAFYEALKADKSMAEALQAKSDEFAKKAAAEAMELVVNFAAEKGYTFTAEDIQAANSEAQEMSEEELSQTNAAGTGIEGHSLCFILGLGDCVGAQNYSFGACKIIGVGIGSWGEHFDL